jgi:hypothetical protein
MTYVSADVAKKIELAVERIKSGNRIGCPAPHGIVQNDDCPYRSSASHHFKPDVDCPKCWRAAALDYIREHAPQDWSAGDRAVIIEINFKRGCEPYVIGDVVAVVDGGDELFARICKDGEKAVSCKKALLRRISNLVAPAQPEAAQPDVGEAVRLYCVEGFADWLTGGNVYDFTPKKEIIFDQRTHCAYDNYQEFASRNPSFSACLVPLVQRPAKVGEWVLVVNAQGSGGRYKDGSVLRRIDPVEFKAHNACYYADEAGHWLCENEYLVLDGYQPAEANPAAPDAERIARLEADVARLKNQLAAIRDLCGKE